MKSSISAIYGKAHADEIYEEVLSLILKVRAQRSTDLKKDDINRNSDWYKDEIVYMFYPDQFGVKEGDKPGTFKILLKCLII